MKIAVIGSGISGLSAAYYLSKKHKVDLFEKEDRFGGHSHTLEISTDIQSKKKIRTDIGFIVFNKHTYPNLINFFSEIGIEIEKSNMSLSFLVKEKNLEYSGKGVRGIFSYKKNLFDLNFLKMFYEIIKFYNKSSKLNDIDENLNLGTFLQKEKMSDFFINYHILPMVSAIWSMPPDNAKNMPIKFFLKFFQNHGLFKLKNRPQWYTVKNRSIEYVNEVIKKISGEHFKNYKIKKVTRSSNSARVFYGGESEYFEYDKVVIATHADEALSIIDEPSDDEKSILCNFKYKKNLAVIHFDETVMPKKKINWSAWNTFVSENNDSSVTYWLNLLQNLNIEKNIFLTLNPHFNIDEKLIIDKIQFSHPYYDHDTLKYQKKLDLLQNKQNILFCGSYHGYGFHGDGIKSTLNMLKFIND